jgi:hypothetical protein
MKNVILDIILKTSFDFYDNHVKHFQYWSESMNINKIAKL